MSLAVVLVLCLAAFAAAYLLYGKLLARLVGLTKAARTPAHECRDGVDYVPTPRFYLLSQHFAAISAAGPIAGPILAALWFGWLPALLWIVLGCIFIGAMHDFASLAGSVKHRARSVAEIMREYLNPRSYVLFTFFIWLALIYVIIAFTDITARAFVQDVEVPPIAGAAALSVKGAGVAGSSMLYLGLAIVMGVFVKALEPPLWLTTVIFVPLVGAAIAAGQYWPIELAASGPIPSLYWAYLILVYCGVASMLPLWLLLQPRGYLGGFFLYVALGGGLLGILIGNPSVQWQAYKGFYSAAGPLVPFLFITIACGACSGFHGLVCSGTTSKQIDKETDAHMVGYGGMLCEGIMALVALACVMSLSPLSPVLHLDAAGKTNPDKIFGYGLGTFLAHLGIPLEFAVTLGMLAFATFVYDTLDVCTRLARYLFQEFTGWRGRAAGVAGTVCSLLLPFLVVGQTVRNQSGAAEPAYMVIWPLFGSSNQLLAGLTLLGLTLWLMRTGKPRLLQALVALPMLFMMSMTLWALWLQLMDARATPMLLTIGGLLFGLALWITLEALLALARRPPAALSTSG